MTAEKIESEYPVHAGARWEGMCQHRKLIELAAQGLDLVPQGIATPSRPPSEYHPFPPPTACDVTTHRTGGRPGDQPLSPPTSLRTLRTASCRASSGLTATADVTHALRAMDLQTAAATATAQQSRQQAGPTRRRPLRGAGAPTGIGRDLRHVPLPTLLADAPFVMMGPKTPPTGRAACVVRGDRRGLDRRVHAPSGDGRGREFQHTPDAATFPAGCRSWGLASGRPASLRPAAPGATRSARVGTGGTGHTRWADGRSRRALFARPVARTGRGVFPGAADGGRCIPAGSPRTTRRGGLSGGGTATDHRQFTFSDSRLVPARSPRVEWRVAAGGVGLRHTDRRRVDGAERHPASARRADGENSIL